MLVRVLTILTLILLAAAGVHGAMHLLGASVPSHAGLWPFGVGVVLGFITSVFKKREENSGT